MKKTAIRSLVLVAASGLLFGCATTQQADLQAQIDDVRAIAEKAAADAAAAKQAAAAAQSRADAAMDTATSAKAQSEETEAKIDRMFKKAMYK
jgi:murein lipoprotein